MMRTTIVRIAAGVLAVVGAEAARADPEAPVAPQALEFCTVCHGVQMMGNATLNAPRLSGMARWYVEAQLSAFRNGWRGRHPEDGVGMTMQSMAAGLSEADVAAAAEFVSKTLSPRPPRSIEGDAALGGRLYEACAACHGADGRGSEALGAPPLVGHNDWYLARQLGNFTAGYRGYDTSDRRGQQMRAASATLTSDEDIRAVVAYIMSLDSD